MYIPQDAPPHPVPPPNAEQNSTAGPVLHDLLTSNDGTPALEHLQKWIGRVGPRAVAAVSRPRRGRYAPLQKRITEHDLNVKIGIIVGVLLGAFLLGTLAFCYIYRFTIRVKPRKKYRRHRHRHHHSHHRHAKSTSSKSSASSDSGGPPPDPAPASPPEPAADPAPESAPEPTPAPAGG